MLAAKIRSLISGLARRSQVEQQIGAELEFHIEARTSDLVARGLDHTQARRQARMEFGSVEKYRDEIRHAIGLRLLDELRADLIYGLRSLRRSPAFTAVATISLAIGIGANTLVFSLINSTFLKPMRHHDARRLVVIWTTPSERPEQTSTSSVDTYFSLRDRSRSFESIGAFNGGGCGVRSLGADRDGAPAERIFGQCFSPSLFEVLGVKPRLGRTFTEAEDQIGNVATVALISNGLWQRRFGGDPDIIGKSLTLNRVPTTIIGTLPADFELFKDPNAEPTRTAELDFVLPLELTPTQVQSRVGGLTIVGRLRPGVSLEAAQAEVQTIAAQLAVSNPELHDGLSARVERLQGAAYRNYHSPLLILEGAVAFVLLIGCANVAGLLLARGASRHGEIALRMALGAGRARVTRQLVAEGLPIAILGGAVGILLAKFGLELFVSIAPVDFPRLDQISLDGRVMGFTALVVFLSSILFAVFPAIQASSVRVGDPLKESGRGATGSRQRLRLRSMLASAQVGLALILLIGAGLMIHSFIRVLQQNLGADPTNLLTFDFRLTQAETVKPFGRYRGLGLWEISPIPAQRVEQVLQRLRLLPGVSAAAAVNLPPFRDQSMPMPFIIEGRPEPGFPQGQQTANYFAVTRGFFGVMKIPLLRGRDFDERDEANAPLVIAINETMARQVFPNEDPIGKHITLDWVPDEKPREIVAILGDSATTPLQRQQAPALYVPHLQQTSKFTGPSWATRSGMYFVLRTAVEPLSLVPAVKTAAAEVDPLTPVADVWTARQTIDNQLRNLRLYMTLLAFFGVVAALLAATGIYGVMAYSVAERRREIGVRIALGGRRLDVVSMILLRGLHVIGAGLILGWVGSFALTRLIQSALFGVTATDPATYVVVSLLLALIGTTACVVPARRAARVDPMVALRYE